MVNTVTRSIKKHKDTIAHACNLCPKGGGVREVWAVCNDLGAELNS